MKTMIDSKKYKGFTLLEVLISMVILIVVTSLILVFFWNVTDTSRRFSSSLIAQQQVQQTLQIIVPELRSAAQSNTGVYPIFGVSSTTLGFYSDIDRDGLFERVRYFLDEDVLKKGVIRPSGEPMGYDIDDEVVYDVVEGVVEGAQIFSFFDGSATSTESNQLPFPINILDIRKVKISLVVNQGVAGKPSIVGVEDLVTIRNLRYK